MSAPALAPALQELVSADPTVKPKALVAQLGRYVLQTPSATFAGKVKQVCKNMGSTTKAKNAGSVLGFASLCRGVGNNADVRVIDNETMKKVYSDVTVSSFCIV